MPTARVQPKTKTSIAIVGAGRLGTALAISLARLNHSITALVARKPANARKAAATLNDTVAAIGSNKLDRLPVSDVIIIATPDDQIEHVVESLLRVQWLKPTSTVFHTSGALSSKLLSPLTKQGWQTGSIHPLLSVSDPEVGANSFQGAFWCVEGDNKARRLAVRLIKELGGKSFSIDASNKPLYHAAAVMASGNVVALFDMAVELMVRCGQTPKNARLILLPLLESTVRNLAAHTPEKALTGTFARGDLATMHRHLDALAQTELADALTLYRLLGRRAIALAGKKGVAPGVLQRIAKELG